MRLSRLISINLFATNFVSFIYGFCLYGWNFGRGLYSRQILLLGSSNVMKGIFLLLVCFECPSWVPFELQGCFQNLTASLYSWHELIDFYYHDVLHYLCRMAGLHLFRLPFSVRQRTALLCKENQYSDREDLHNYENYFKR